MTHVKYARKKGIMNWRANKKSINSFIADSGIYIYFTYEININNFIYIPKNWYPLPLN